MFRLDLEKAEEPEIKLPTSTGSSKKQDSPRKIPTSAVLTMLNIYFCFIDYAKAFDCVDHNKLENSSRDRNIRPPDLPPEKSVCRSKATVRTGHGTTDWLQFGKGLHQGCILSPYLLSLYAEYNMQNVRLDEAQAGIKIAGRNINNLKYIDGTSLMAESK